MWKEVPSERYDDMLGMLPPAVYSLHGFLVGEPHDHRKCTVSGLTRATYAAFIHYKGSYYEGPNMTVAEFMALDVTTVPQKQ